jgi:hypothetical protein
LIVAGDDSVCDIPLEEEDIYYFSRYRKDWGFFLGSCFIYSFFLWSERSGIVENKREERERERERELVYPHSYIVT